jgi:hypothetical protein
MPEFHSLGLGDLPGVTVKSQSDALAVTEHLGSHGDYQTFQVSLSENRMNGSEWMLCLIPSTDTQIPQSLLTMLLKK